MRVRELGSLILLGVVIGSAIIGISARYWTKQQDSTVEELSEAFIEGQIEKALDLKEDALDGKIDLSPGSPE